MAVKLTNQRPIAIKHGVKIPKDMINHYQKFITLLMNFLYYIYKVYVFLQ